MEILKLYKFEIKNNNVENEIKKRKKKDGLHG